MMDFEKETFSNVVISTKLVDVANLQWWVSNTEAQIPMTA